MPRFLVAICDTTDGEMQYHTVRALSEVEATLSHPWISNMYKDSWVSENFWSESFDNCRQNIWSLTSWSVMCVNLDQEIMNDLNAGDSSASSTTTQLL